MSFRIRVILTITFLFIPFIAYSVPSPTPTIGSGFIYENFATNGVVYCVTNTANQLYIGGSFSLIGKRIGSLMQSDYLGNQVVSPYKFPQVDGSVLCVVPDSSGGYFIGGSFLNVAGQPRTRLAHIFSDGELDPNWTPAAGSTVRCMTATATDVYIGGSFTSVAGSGGAYQSRLRWASLSAATGALNAADCSFNSTVYTVGLVPGYSNYLAVGGAFTSVSNTAKNYLAMINPASGTLWSYDYGINGIVYSVAFGLSPATYAQLYVGGSFTQANLTARNRMAMFNYWYSPATLSAFDPNLNNTVRDIYFDEVNKSVYTTGYFTTTNGGLNIRNYAAAFVTATSAATAWNPNLGDYGYCISADPTYIYIGGAFTTVNGGSNIRYYAACFNKTTGGIYANYNPDPTGAVNAISAGSVTLANTVIGGSFSGCNAVSRNNAASVPINSYGYYSWNPNTNGPVYSISQDFGRVYLGGNFTTVNGGVARTNAAAFDTSTGTVDASWIANTDSTVRAIYANDADASLIDFVYLGGDFTTVNGTVRNYAAAVDPASGAINTSFDAGINGSVYAINARPNASWLKFTIQLGGAFTLAKGSTARNYYAEFSYNSAQLQSFDPNFNNYVGAIHNDLKNNIIYIGGSFTTAGAGVYGRNRLAAYDNFSAPAINGFAPNINSNVAAIDTTYNALLIGGGFTDVNGSVRYYSAVFDLYSMALSSWAPESNSSVSSILGYDKFVFLGGYFSLVDFLPHGAGAVIECPKEMYTFTVTRTITPTYTSTRTPTPTSTRTPTPTHTRTVTMTPTFTGTGTPTSTRTVTPTVTQTPVSVFAYPFFDSFVSDAYKWDYGIEWERGPATASSGHSTGFPDPSVDVSSGADNNIAGTVIGGNMSVAAVHPYYYLTSSYINTAGAPNLELRFWRYLNTDYPSYLPCQVDVYNGTAWVNIYTSDSSTFDSAWTEQVFDVTDYRNPQFRVRFGHSVLSTSGVWTMSGWNIDDVYVGVPYTPTLTQTYTLTPTMTMTYTETPTPCLVLDMAFNGAGYNMFDKGDMERVRDMAEDGNDSLVVAGNMNEPGNDVMAVWRFDRFGNLDGSFNGSGFALYDGVGPGIVEELMSVKVDSSDRVIAAGYSENGGVFSGTLLRFNDSGLDFSFNGTGVVSSPTVAFLGVAVDRLGRYVVGGGTMGSNFDAVIMRFNQDGSPDLTFNFPNGYMVIPDSGVNEYVWRISTDKNNNVIAAGSVFNGADNDIAVWKVFEDGSQDTSFNGGAGVYTFNSPFGGYDEPKEIILDDSGRIVVLGRGNNIENAASNGDGVVIRLYEDGSPDFNFNAPQSWRAIDNYSYWENVEDIAEDANRRLVITGSTYNGFSNYDMAIWRLMENGQTDYLVSPSGIFMQNGFFNSDDRGAALIIDDSNRIVTAGSTYNWINDDLIIWRHTDICSVFNTPTPTITMTRTRTPTYTVTRTVTPTGTPTFTRTATPTFTRTGTPSVTSSITPSPTFTFTRTGTPSGTPTVTATPTGTFTVTWTGTPTSTGTPTFTGTATATPTFTPTFTRTTTFTVTQTITPTYTISQTSTNIVFTWTITPTHSITPTITPTYTRTDTPSVTQTVTQTVTGTSTYTFTYTLTLTLTVTQTYTPTFTPTYTRTNTPSVTMTFTMTVTATVTNTVTESSTLTWTLTHTPTDTRTITQTVTETVTLQNTQTVTRTNTSTRTITMTRTITSTRTVTETGTATDSPTPTVSPTGTNTARPSNTPTLSSTITDTFTFTFTLTATPTVTSSYTPTVTLTFTVTNTGTYTVTMTSSLTVTLTPTETDTPASTATPSVTETQCPPGVLGSQLDSGGTFAVSTGSTLAGSRFELLQDATVLRIKVYVETGSSNGQIVAAVYTDLNGHPDTLLIPTSPQSRVIGWNTIELPATSLEKAVYWIMIQAQTGVRLYYYNSTSGSGATLTNGFGILPDPITGDALTTRIYSVYADFCPDLGYLVTATATPTATETATNTPTFTATSIYTPTFTPSVTQTATRVIPMPDDDSYTFPLPADASMQFVFILGEDATEASITVFDFAGNLVRIGNQDSIQHLTAITAGVPVLTQQVDVSRLRPGIYYYLIKAKSAAGTDIKMKVKKFIIKR